MRKHRIVLTLLAVAGASVALWPSASAAPALEKPRTFSLLEVNRSETPLDDLSDRTSVGGHQFVVVSDLYRWTATTGRGPRVGRDRVLLTFMSGFGEKFTHNAIVLVTAQVYLPDGSLMVEGYGTIPPNKPARMTLPVVGGTGVYMNARGYLAVRSAANGGRTRLDFHLVP